MSLPSNLTFTSPGLFWPALAVLIGAGLLLVWGYRNGRSGAIRWVCGGLKLLGLAALLACLLEPQWSGQKARPGSNFFAVLVDNSQSLQVKDPGGDKPRADTIRSLLNAQPRGWQGSLEDNFELRRYYFDARLQTSRDLSELTFDGRASNLGAALRGIADHFRGRPLAGVLVLTDGNATDMRAAADVVGLPPIYPVVVGSDQPVKDIALGQVQTISTDFEDAPVTINAPVNASGYRGATVLARVLDETGKVVAQQTLRPRADEEELTFRMQFRPEKPGLSFYQVNVRTQSEASQAKNEEKTEEATLANNGSFVAVERGRGPYRILYVAGRPNWEFKFLNRAVQADDQLQLVGLIRVANREPKFKFLGRAGETSNPLFRGFGDQSAEQVERYDQPVLARLNTRDGLELRGGFPHKAEELYAYHAVIIDDLEAGFFSPDQATLLQKYVSERGGGLLMLGGMESFQQGNYHQTPIGDMLPVYLDHIPERSASGSVTLDLTREGWLQSWLRLRDNEADEKTRLKSMPGLQVINPMAEVKPGATVLATASDADGKQSPALVVQRFGRGHTGALAIGDLWRWGMHDESAHADLDKAWRQLMRWLVNDVPNRVDLAAETREGPEGSALLQVRARDEAFQALDSATVSLEVQPIFLEAGTGAQTNIIRLPTEPSSSESSLYEARYLARTSGAYKASVCVTNTDGVEAGRAVAGWAVDMKGAEFRSLKPNRTLLEDIARTTKGELIRPDQLDRLVGSLPHRHAPIMETWSYPLWHTPVVFAFALLCFLAEWGLRRLKGMP